MKKVNLLLKLIVTLGTLFYINAVLAEDYGKKYMHVTISNRTNGDCKNIPSEGIIDGELEGAFPPGFLSSGASAGFYLRQCPIHGYNIILAYDCSVGNVGKSFKHVAFEISQNSSVFLGHSPSLKLLQSQSSGLTASIFSVKSSSVLHLTNSDIVVSIEEA